MAYFSVKSNPNLRKRSGTKSRTFLSSLLWCIGFFGQRELDYICRFLGIDLPDYPPRKAALERDDQAIPQNWTKTRTINGWATIGHLIFC
jgi:hypothetical protein